MKKQNRKAVRLALIFCAALSFGAGARPVRAGEGTLIYRKVFKGSEPEFVEIKVSESGQATFDLRQLSEDPSPEPFEIGSMLRDKMFALTAELGYFRNADLDVHRRIANLGAKTFRYEKDGEAHEATFNYTLNSIANQLLQIFEGLVRQQTHIQTLQQKMRYDRLGVNAALLNLQTDYDDKVIPEPERLLPVLEQIANDEHIMEMARQRARAIAARIRGAK